MKRKCVKCDLPGIKVGKILITGPTQCEFCGTEYAVARYANLPYVVTGIVAVLFLLSWLTGTFNAFVFLLLSGIWLAFEFAWEALVPLTPAQPPDKEDTTPDKIVL